jgi:hypothetical protein
LPREKLEDIKMSRDTSLNFEKYFSAALVVCGISWFWDYVSSLYFPAQTALNLTIISALVYMEAALIGAYGFTRRIQFKQISVGIKVGLGAFMVNTVFRLIVFEIVEALWGIIIYFTSFVVGGLIGGLIGKKLHSTS